jgi:hypothetical protein
MARLASSVTGQDTREGDHIMSVVSRRQHRFSRITLAVGIALLLPAMIGCGAAFAQTTDQTTAGTDEAIPAPAPSIFPQATASSQTCLFGCSTQLQACQNTCISTITGATVIPSMTTAGTTSNPTTCQTNCSTQQTACQRNCNLGP